jgi:hypothetical protein
MRAVTELEVRAGVHVMLEQILFESTHLFRSFPRIARRRRA